MFNNCNFIKSLKVNLDQLHVFFYTFEQSLLTAGSGSVKNECLVQWCLFIIYFCVVYEYNTANWHSTPSRQNTHKCETHVESLFLVMTEVFVAF